MLKQCSIPGCAASHLARGYCSRHYQRLKKYGDPLHVAFERGATIEESFRLHTTEADGCLIWTGGLGSNDTYGQVWYQGGMKPAHRVAWQMVNGEIPAGMVIDHICHVQLCVNPAHLRLATPKQNRENTRGASKTSTTGIQGAYWREKNQKFLAQVKHNGVTYYLGLHETAEGAGEIARLKRLELFTHNDFDRKNC